MIGIVGPWTRPVVGEVMADGAAQQAGLREGDVVLRIGTVDVVATEMWVTFLAASILPSRPMM